MNMPKAPADPEKRRDSFYIIKDKEIFGARMENGSGIQYLYQDGERLVNSAVLSGGIQDEEELRLLRSVEGFRKLVHSIGVSAETEDPAEDVIFRFQMYGRKDIYGGGTVLETVLKGNGAEKRIYMSEATWREDDSVPGQIQVILEHAECMAKLNVRLYLNDGYGAPELSEEDEIDFSSVDYKNMIADSLISTGDTGKLKRVIQAAESGRDVTIAYIGGSITQGAGAAPINTKCYAAQSYRMFQERYGKGGRIHFIKAGVGGTPSELGMIRFDRDVLRDGMAEPDIVIIEFAVNDEGDETKGDCYESLVRKALNFKSRPAVILLFSVFADDGNLQERLQPVGRHYNLPMVSIRDAVVKQFYKKRGEGRVLTKNQFFYDIFHPSNVGHRIMADCLGYLWEQTVLSETSAETKQSLEELMKKPPLYGNTFEHVRLLDRKDGYDKATIRPGGFAGTDKVLQCVEMDDNLEPVPEFPYNWHYDGKNAVASGFRMEITCRALVLVFKDSGETDAARADIYVDGRFVRTADPFVNGWVHCNAMIILNEEESGRHMVYIEPEQGKKCTILGFGYVE